MVMMAFVPTTMVVASSLCIPAGILWTYYGLLVETLMQLLNQLVSQSNANPAITELALAVLMVPMGVGGFSYVLCGFLGYNGCLDNGWILHKKHVESY